MIHRTTDFRPDSTHEKNPLWLLVFMVRAMTNWHSLLARAGIATLMTAVVVPIPSVSADCNCHDCELTPVSVEGPYFIELHKIRSDVRENATGVNLGLKFQIVDIETCSGISGASVEIWSCDAQGFYSGYRGRSPDEVPKSARHQMPTDNSTFLRGGQVSDDEGYVRFLTKVPGYYAGRAIHLHVLVSVLKWDVFVGQMYMPEDIIEHILQEPAYHREPDAAPRVRNEEDIYFVSSGGNITTLLPTVAYDGSLQASRRLGVKLRAKREYSAD